MDKAPQDAAAADKAAHVWCADILAYRMVAAFKPEYEPQIRAELRKAFVAGWYAHKRSSLMNA